MRTLGLLALLAVVTPAYADDVVEPVVAPRLPPPRPQLELQWTPIYEVIWRIGVTRIDGVDSDAIDAIGLAAGIHHDHLALLAEYSLGGVGYHVTVENARGDSTPETIGSNGLEHRFGAVARYSLVKLASEQDKVDATQLFGDLYLDAGVGVEVMHWDGGGTLVRPDLALGIGMTVGGHISPTQRGAFSLGLRLHIARRDDRDNLAETCSAPCSWPTQPAAWSDRSILAETAFAFGR